MVASSCVALFITRLHAQELKEAQDAVPAGEDSFSHSVGALDDILQLLSLADAQTHCSVPAQIPYTSQGPFMHSVTQAFIHTRTWSLACLLTDSRTRANICQMA